MSSDLSGLLGVFPPSLRWNAEIGLLGVAVYSLETGERELKEIELGKSAAFAMDMATRERGYGLIRAGVYSMCLSAVGSPLPACPDDGEHKPALGCWVWSPMHGELRVETNAQLFRTAVAAVWEEAKVAPEAAAGLTPVVCFTDRVQVTIKSVGKTFYRPVIKIAGWVGRDKIPGWSERAPTVPPPKALEALPTTPAIDTQVKKTAKAKARPKPAASDPDDSIDDILGGDPIPFA
jgi:hypothetical protein